MPTPSEAGQGTGGGPGTADWAARPAGPRRSVFGNYPSAPAAEIGLESRSAAAVGGSPAPDRGFREPLQAAIDAAVARSFLYRFIAQAYEDPAPDGWSRLLGCVNELELAVHTLAGPGAALRQAAVAWRSRLDPGGLAAFRDSYLAAFGHAARGGCPLNETEYGEMKADPLFQPHRLADLAAFYRAFGLEVAADAGERQDHLSLEFEFMCVLAAKEACALEHQGDPEELAVCREAQKSFLRDHLGKWTPAFARRLARAAGDTALGALADLTRAFVESECGRCGVTPGSEDLQLRPVDEAAESLCDSCGLKSLPPGASGSADS